MQFSNLNLIFQDKTSLRADVFAEKLAIRYQYVVYPWNKLNKQYFPSVKNENVYDPISSNFFNVTFYVDSRYHLSNKQVASQHT